MMNNSALDEHIKKQFGNYTPDVPPHIWENIMAEKEKRKPVGFWPAILNKNTLILLSVILIGSTSVIVYKNVSSSNKIIAAEKNNSIDQQEAADKTTRTNNISSENNNDKNSTAENNLSTGIKPIKKTNTNSVENKSIPTVKDKVFHNKKNNLTASSTNNDIPSSVEFDKTISNSFHKKLRKENQKGMAVVSVKDPELADDVTNSANEYDASMSRLLLNLDMIRATRISNLSITTINNPHLNVPCPEAEKNAAGNKKYLEIYAGSDYAFRSIKDTGNSIYSQKRKESTTFSSAFSAGLRYTRVFSNGMSFRTGINYSQINEKFKFTEGNIIQVVYVTDMNGDTTGSYTSVGTRYKTTHNKFRTLDVPIMVGYELGNGRLHVNINAGAVVNLYSWQKGDVLDTTYQPVSITTGKSNSPYQFKTNVGIGFMGAVSVYYKLTDRLHILAEPYFRYNFSPASKSDLTLKQKYNTAGLRLGVRIDF